MNWITSRSHWSLTGNRMVLPYCSATALVALLVVGCGGQVGPDANIVPVPAGQGGRFSGSGGTSGSGDQAAIGGDTNAQTSASANSNENIETVTQDQLDSINSSACNAFSWEVDAGQTESCRYTYDSSKLQGASVEVQKVNVIYRVNGSTLLYNMRLIGMASDSTCPEVNGWFIDPTDESFAIQLCPKTCEIIQGDPGAILDIQTGCWPGIITN